MKTEEIVDAARNAGFSSSEIMHRLAAFKRLIQYSTSAEREKCTGTQEFVTLPREVVEQAIEALFCTDSEGGSTAYKNELEAVKKLRAALDQPQNHIEHHLGMVPAGWRLVPVAPTREMIEAGKGAHYEAEKRIQEPDAWSPGGFAKRAVRATHVFQAMLAAAPQPTTVKECLTVEQPQANQPAMTPIAQRKLDSLLTEGYTISGYSVYHERKHQHGFVTGAGLVGWWKPEGMEYPQPQGEQEPFAWISHRALEWGTRQSEKVVKLTCKAQPKYDFTEPLYTHPQNLRCKSNQARLATLWGYVKAGQPQGEQETVTIPCECPHIIWFDDSDMRPMMFAGNGARDAALKAFERVSVQWNAHLFVRIQKNSRDDQYPCAQLHTPPTAKARAADG